VTANPTPTPTPAPTHDEISELLGAWALDAVDPSEAATVEEHLATCPRCRVEVAQHREVAARLAYPGETAPPGVWDRIAACLEETPPPLDMARITPLERDRRRRRSIRVRTAAVVAAVAAAVIAGLAIQVQRLDSRSRRLDAAVRARQDLARLAAQPGTTTVTLRSTDGAMFIKAFVGSNGDSVIDGNGLPALPAGREYQLWGVRGNGKISLLLLGSRPELAQFRSPSDVQALAVTEESAGGAVTPGRVVVSGFA
jgi:hypothetical protein